MSATFTWDLRSDELTWSDPMFDLYGYAPGSLQPTMRLLLEHKHPADRSRLQQLLRTTKRDATPYVYRHRIIAADGEVRDVVVSASATVSSRGNPVEITGTAIDMTNVIVGPSFTADEREAVELRKQVAHLERALEGRDLIGQAKGILMQTYRIGADEAFELISLASQRTNRKVAELAEEITVTGKLTVD